MANGQVEWKSAIIGAALVLAVIGAVWAGYNWPSDGPTALPATPPRAAQAAATPTTPAIESAPQVVAIKTTVPSPAFAKNGGIQAFAIAREHARCAADCK